MKKEITVHFLNGDNAGIEMHYLEKQYRNDVIVQIDAKYYEVYFFVEDLLHYEMTGDGYFSLPGLIVLNAMSTDKILKALAGLVKTGYFNWFKGHEQIPYNKSFADAWYVKNGSGFDESLLMSRKLEV